MKHNCTVRVLLKWSSPIQPYLGQYVVIKPWSELILAFIDLFNKHLILLLAIVLGARCEAGSHQQTEPIRRRLCLPALLWASGIVTRDGFVPFFLAVNLQLNFLLRTFSVSLFQLLPHLYASYDFLRNVLFLSSQMLCFYPLFPRRLSCVEKEITLPLGTKELGLGDASLSLGTPGVATSEPTSSIKYMWKPLPRRILIKNH